MSTSPQALLSATPMTIPTNVPVATSEKMELRKQVLQITKLAVVLFSLMLSVSIWKLAVGEVKAGTIFATLSVVGFCATAAFTIFSNKRDYKQIPNPL